MRPINRLAPKMPSGYYKTYSILAPLQSHFRPATCDEVSCRAHMRGWVSPIDERTVDGQKHAYYIRKVAKRRYAESKDAGGLTVFEFPPGQQCFRKHVVPLERPELFVVRDGDYRGNPRQTEPVRHSRPEFWVEDWQEHHQKVKSAMERG